MVGTQSLEPVAAHACWWEVMGDGGGWWMVTDAAAWAHGLMMLLHVHKRENPTPQGVWITGGVLVRDARTGGVLRSSTRTAALSC